MLVCVGSKSLLDSDCSQMYLLGLSPQESVTEGDQEAAKALIRYSLSPCSLVKIGAFL